MIYVDFKYLPNCQEIILVVSSWAMIFTLFTSHEVSNLGRSHLIDAKALMARLGHPFEH